jgi:hypothetical protein
MNLLCHFSSLRKPSQASNNNSSYNNDVQKSVYLYVVFKSHLMIPDNQDKKIVFRSNTKETAHLILAGKRAAEKAIRENRALGLPFTYTKGSKVLRENSNGLIEEIKDKPLQSSLKIKKGTILYVKSK